MSKEYKDTLIMPNTELEMKANLPSKEPHLQSFWLKNNIYQKVLKQNKNLPEFVLHDGPPYANGNIHIGHALNKILKDIIIRNKNMNGYYAHYIPGWDTHGLPIENAISKLDQNFENKLSAIEKRKKCYKYAIEQVNNQQSQFMQLGLITDFKDKYLTLDKKFEKHELILFKEMIKQGIVYQDFKPVYWSWSSLSSLADAEIEYKNIKSPSIYVSFKINKPQAIGVNNLNLIIWTTTPWTIPANLAIAINPKFKYYIIQVKKQNYVIEKTLTKKVLEELEFKDYKIIKEVSGSDLELIQYVHPLTKKLHPIILAEYVSNENGTGLVHNAPGFGLEDYYACKKYNIDVYCPIDDWGKYNNEIYDPSLVGIFYNDANKIITERLKNTNNLLKLDFINHSVAHDWRTKKPVIYRATKQWFVNTKILHKSIINNLNKVNSSMSSTINRMKEMIINRDEWCISRQRVWGVPIPIIYDENKEPILDLELIDNIIEILYKEGTDIWFEKDIKYFLTNKYLSSNKKYTKEEDILDVWFDSGSSFMILNDYKLHYPADLYLEGSDQFRGWFNSSLICGTIMSNNSPYKYLLQHGFTLDEKGNKMSKSLGNVISPIDVVKEYGADILRMWVASSDYTLDTKFGFNILKQTCETYRKIRNTLFRYSLSNLHDFNPQNDLQTKLCDEDLFILHRLKEVIENINYAYEQYKFIDVIKIVNNFTIELSQWYFDIIKDALYCNEQKSIRRKQIQTVLYYILDNFLIILTPIIPHTCEEVYQLFNKLNKLESVVLEKNCKNIPYKCSQKIIDSFNAFFMLKDKIYIALENARNKNIIKKNNEATIFLNQKLIKNINFNLEQLKFFLNVAELEIDNVNEIIVKKNNLIKCLRCWNYYQEKNINNDEVCIRCAQVLKSL